MNCDVIRSLLVAVLAISTVTGSFAEKPDTKKSRKKTADVAADAKTADTGTGTKISNRLTVAGSSVVSIVLVKDTKARSEMHFPDGDMVRIEECGGSRILHLNDTNRTYFYEQTGEGLQSRESSPGSGGVVTVVSKTTATGEQKEILGRMARHLKTEIKTESASAACGGNTVLVADGWYVDLDAVPQCLSRDIEKMLRERLRTMGCDAKLHFQISGNALSGYPVVLDMTLREAVSADKDLLPDGKPVTVHQETREIASVELSDDLFRVPEGYREVTSMQELLGNGSADGQLHTQANANGENAVQQDDPTQLTGQTEASGTVRIGVAFPELDAAGAKVSAESIRQQIAEELRASGVDAVPLESEIKADALKECKPKQCSHIMLEKVSIGRPAGNSAAASHSGARGYEARIEFTIVPASHPAQHLDGDNFYDSADVKVSIAAAVEQAVATIKNQIGAFR